MNRPDLQTLTYCIKNTRKSYESQAPSISQLFIGKSEQKITTNKPFSLESTREDGVTFSYRVVRDAVHSGKKRRSALWLNAVHSGKK